MRHRRSALPIFASFLVILLGVSACGDDDDPAGPSGSFDLAFTGDASFHNAHGGQDIYVFVTSSSGTVVASGQGIVSASQEPAFSFSFSDVLAEGESYDLNYWIDSNFGGGTEGACDSPDVDHQWQIDIAAVSSNVTMEDTHRPAEVEPVCTDSEADETPGY